MTPRDVTFVQDTLDRIILEAAWLHTHCADIHQLAYGQTSAGDGIHVAVSGHHDLGDRIGHRPQDTWRTLTAQLRHIEIALAALEHAATKLFTAGELDLTDPAGNKHMPARQWAQVQAARRRRILRGEYHPALLGD